MLNERDYMNRTAEERSLEAKHRAAAGKASKDSRMQADLWRLYGKEHKSIIDRLKIKLIEHKNMHRH